MRKYRSDADSATRIDFALDVIEALRAFPETSLFAGELEATNEGLDSIYEKRGKLRKPWMRSRARLRICEYKLEQVIRSTHKAAQLTDGGRTGAITEIVFPDGVTPVIIPSGEKQTKVAEELLGRIAGCKSANAESYRTEWHAKLHASVDEFKGALAGYEGAKKAYYAAFAEELAARDEHERKIDRIMGQVRAAFPKDTAKQNLIFPKATRSADDDAEEVSDLTPAL